MFFYHSGHSISDIIFMIVSLTQGQLHQYTLHKITRIYHHKKTLKWCVYFMGQHLVLYALLMLSTHSSTSKCQPDMRTSSTGYGRHQFMSWLLVIVTIVPTCFSRRFFIIMVFRSVSLWDCEIHVCATVFFKLHCTKILWSHELFGKWLHD